MPVAIGAAHPGFGIRPCRKGQPDAGVAQRAAITIARKTLRRDGDGIAAGRLPRPAGRRSLDGFRCHAVAPLLALSAWAMPYMVRGRSAREHYFTRNAPSLNIMNGTEAAIMANGMTDSMMNRAGVDALPENAIEIRGLSKIYRGAGGAAHQALDGVDLNIPRGCLFGLLGPNGAGKSTLINIMAGLTLKTSGAVRIWDRDVDQDPRNARAAIGIMPQEINIDPFFTPRALLDIQAGLYGVPRSRRRTDEILKMIGLWDKRDAYARTLSGGMRRRLLVGKALVHSPPILVLDEPTAGVDIELRRQLWQNVRTLNRQGTTVLLTTHYLEEAEEMCDSIAIIDRGRVIANDRTGNLLARLGTKTLRLLVRGHLAEVPETLRAHGAALGQATAETTQITVTYNAAEVSAGQIIQETLAAGLTLVDVTTHQTDLEDVFVQLTSGNPAEA